MGFLYSIDCVAEEWVRANRYEEKKADHRFFDAENLFAKTKEAVTGNRKAALVPGE